jgi:transglutaminase-like putative cysteine protease
MVVEVTKHPDGARRESRARRALREHRRVTYRKELTPFALAAAIALAAVACDGGDGGSGTRPNGAAPSNKSPTMVPQTSSDPSFPVPLTADQARNLFEVEADHGQYWRMTTLDRYDGESWTSTNPFGSEGGESISAPATLPRSGGSLPPGAETLDQTFRILSDFDIAHALPMAQTAEEIAGPIGDITWDPARSQAFIDGDLKAGMEYTVRSRIVVPTPEELDQVYHLAPQTYGRWTELPADLDPRIGEMAERWTAGATSDYRKVLAIQQHFHSGEFIYSTDVETADDADALLEFLTQTKAGFCQQYTAAMTVMARALGLPTRIGVGYRSGTLQEDGSYLVQTTDAHVWVEVLFPGYGWLQFEPEPGTAHPNAQAGTYLNPIAPTDAS